MKAAVIGVAAIGFPLRTLRTSATGAEPHFRGSIDRAASMSYRIVSTTRSIRRVTAGGRRPAGSTTAGRFVIPAVAPVKRLR